MENCGSQLNLKPSSITELRKTLCKLLPTLEKLIPLAREFCEQNKAASTSLPCESCPKQKYCSEPCEKLNSLLPKINSGKSNHEKNAGFYINSLQDIEKTRLIDLYEQYEACKHIFTKKQWSVIYLYYHEGMTQSHIANQLGKSRKSVSGLFIRAKQQKGDYYAQLRREKADYLKKKRKSYDD
ncbi:MAG: sigma factor-like helix-turn-helix DNA-binding protein [Planctomycetota bacterium]